ncbi:MAG: hypothetical protein QOE82_1167 [Thermoanaerobaculia bacterium]|jgi:hypothetical protein|nr:hypothetical protein [Thermoanaerobaculia bacterium]
MDPLRAAARGERVEGLVDAATLAAASAEGVTGLLAHLAVDPSRELLVMAAAIEAKSRYLAGELVRLVEAFRDANVPLLALKGPVLSKQLYGDSTLRMINDIDVIVPFAQTRDAEELLRSLGYRDEVPMTAAQRDIKHRFHSGTPFRNEERGTTVDLHWRFGHVQFPIALDFDEVWRRCAEVEIGGVNVPTLGWTDLVIFTCSHAAKHFWSKLEMLAQVTALSRSDAIDWPEVDRLAVAARSARQVGLSFLIAHDVLGIELPRLPRCLDLSRPKLERMRQRLQKVHEHDAGGRDLFMILDRRRDVLAAMAAAIFVPTHADWSAGSTGPSAWLLRPFRLAWQRLRR